MSHLKLSLLGVPHVECAGVACKFEARKALALLAYLAVTGECHSRDALAALFWPDDSQKCGRANLRYALWALKKTVGEDWLQTDRECVGLASGSDLWLDVAHFYAPIVAWRTHDHPAREVCPACWPGLRQAAALYRGELLAGFNLADSPDFEEWLFFERQTLQQGLVRVLEGLVAGYQAQGDYIAALASARRWLALDPLHEPAHRQLMQLYAWSGQQAAALRQYQECVRLLQHEIEVSPDQATTDLY